MIDMTVLGDEGIIVVEPTASLEAADFDRLATIVDGYAGSAGALNGLLIHTRQFPGWEDFDAFVGHMKFIRGHHKTVKRIAVVTDSTIGAVGPGIARHFLAAELQHFRYDDMPAARAWLAGAR